MGEPMTDFSASAGFVLCFTYAASSLSSSVLSCSRR